jgi:hypothetical protein
MKLTFLFSIAFLIGCASQPKWKLPDHVINPQCDAAYLCVDGTTGIFVIQEGPLRVTPAQWEAAQGLYNPHRLILYGTGTITETPPLCLQANSPSGPLFAAPCGSNDSTFPPSGDAK